MSVLKKYKKIPFRLIAILLLLTVSAALLLSTVMSSSQSIEAAFMDLEFVGDYRIGDGPWQPVEDSIHIPAGREPVTLRGTFWVVDPYNGSFLGPAEAGLMIAFYLNHISVTVEEAGTEPHVMDNENPVLGKTVCGQTWTCYALQQDSTEPLTMVIRNYHRFGNRSAMDEMLRQFAPWMEETFEQSLIHDNDAARISGLLIFASAIVLLGIALFSWLLHMKETAIFWSTGLTIMFASGYFIFSLDAASLYNRNDLLYTTLQGLCMFLYMLFLSGLITYTLKKTKKIGAISVGILALTFLTAAVLCTVTPVSLYDTYLFWVVVQTAAVLVFMGCLTAETIGETWAERRLHLALFLPMIAYLVDVFATARGLWSGGLVSKYVFIVMYAFSLILLWRVIPQSINAAAMAKELETQKALLEAALKESRVAIMLSQIQPHFIYNTLGTIERMCLKDPGKAFELVRNFSLYLRGNFSELNSVTPIPFPKEMDHVRYYENIEKVRFPDMEILYDLQVTDFVLPALSVQPLVENAIKHGLMRLEIGGAVTVRSYEDEEFYFVQVSDNGIGFDTSAPIDTKKHVGLRNIRGRLKAIVNGTLTVESEPGKGTTATIRIPKEKRA